MSWDCYYVYTSLGYYTPVIPNAPLTKVRLSILESYRCSFFALVELDTPRLASIIAEASKIKNLE
jgi:hypothetical protein